MRIGNAIGITQPFAVLNTEIPLPSGDYLATDTSEFAAAIIAHNGAADGPERTLVLAHGDYDLSSVNFTGRTWDNKPLKILGQSRAGVRFVGGGSNLNNSSHITFENFTLYRSRDYIENTGNPAFFLGSGSTHDMTWTNWAIQGDIFTESELNDSVIDYASGMPMPNIFDLSASGQRIVVENGTCHTVRAIGTFPQTDGTRVRNITGDVLYFDGIRMAANVSSADGDLWIVEDVTMNRFVGKHNENTGGSAPHNDATQTYNKGGDSITGGGVGIYRRIIANQGEGRGSLLQFGLVEGTSHTAIIFDACAGVIDSVHGPSIEQGNAPMQAMAINCTFAGRGDNSSPQFRDTSAQGFMTVVNSVFTGTFQRNGTASTPSHHENRGSVFSFDPAEFEGDLNPTTIAEVRSNLVVSAGSSGEGKGALRAGGVLADASNVPFRAAAPTLAAVTGGFEITRAVPAELNGATVASYDALYRDGSNTYTLVTGIASADEAVTVAGGTYSVWTRPVTTDDIPGLWSEEGTVTVGAVASAPTVLGTPVFADSTASTATVSTTPGAGSSRAIIVGISVFSGSRTVTSLSATCGGVAMTPLETDTSTGAPYFEIVSNFILFEEDWPAGTTFDCVATADDGTVSNMQVTAAVVQDVPKVSFTSSDYGVAGNTRTPAGADVLVLGYGVGSNATGAGWTAVLTDFADAAYGSTAQGVWGSFTTTDGTALTPDFDGGGSAREAGVFVFLEGA